MPLTEAGGDDDDDNRELVSIATFNISDGRGAGLASAGRAMDLAGIDIAFVQESKFMDDTHATKYYEAYTILTAATDHLNRGGGLIILQDGRVVPGGEWEGAGAKLYHV